MQSEIQCAICGKTIIQTNNRQKHCRDCAIEINRQRSAARNEAIRNGTYKRKREPRVEEPPKVEKPKPAPSKLIEKALQAKQLGISYGQLQARRSIEEYARVGR